jgi:hypothetical protein
MKQNSLWSRAFLAALLLVLATTTTTTTTSLPLGANNEKKKNHKKPVRGGFIPKHHNNRRLILPPPRMVTSSSRLAHKKRRGQMFLKSPPLTLVRYANEDVLVVSPFSNKNKHQLKVASQKPLVSIKPLDASIFLTYFCSSVAMSLPILLLPMAASEFSTATTSTSSLVVSVTSKALLGGAVGKCINGFLCQEFGGKPCSMFHLTGTAVCSLFFSMATTPATLGMAHAGIEFFVSIQWTALSVILAQHYSQDAASFSKGITTLSLASTCGQLVAKFGGVFLLQQSMDWRMVAQFGALVALLGSCLVGTLVSERPSTKIIGRKQKKPVLSLDELVGNMTESARAVLSNPLFWGIASAHAMSMIARSSDRILGEFFAHATNLPRE